MDFISPDNFAALWTADYLTIPAVALPVEGPWLVAAVAVVSALAIVGARVWHRRYQQQRRRPLSETRGSKNKTGPQKARALTSQTPGPAAAADRGTLSGSTPSVTVGGAAGALSKTEQADFPFAAPDDAGKPGGHSPLPRRYCPTCDRRYELTALFCYHDGHQLQLDHRRLADAGTDLKVCRDCGWEGQDSDQCKCPEDGAELTVLAPGEHGVIAPVFPFTRCRRCGQIGGPGQAHCPVDGSLMLPVQNIRLTALPPLGHGPRRKICTKCGAEFGGHCAFCSYDGQELATLN